MDHDRLKEQVFALRDGELPAAERAAAEAHLAACAECAALARGWERLSSALLSARPEPSGAFVARVLARLDEALPLPAAEGRVGGMSWPYWLVPAFGLAFATLVTTTSRPRQDLGLSPEHLALADAREDAATRWTAGIEEPGRDELLGFTLEAR